MYLHTCAWSQLKTITKIGFLGFNYLWKKTKKKVNFILYWFYKILQPTCVQGVWLGRREISYNNLRLLLGPNVSKSTGPVNWFSLRFLHNALNTECLGYDSKAKFSTWCGEWIAVNRSVQEWLTDT